MSKPIGYFVMESCEQYEQALGVRHDDKTPPGGILDWTDGAKALFSDKATARAAIERTEHFRLAWGLLAGDGQLPEKKFCRIVPVIAA